MVVKIDAGVCYFEIPLPCFYYIYSKRLDYRLWKAVGKKYHVTVFI